MREILEGVEVELSHTPRASDKRGLVSTQLYLVLFYSPTFAPAWVHCSSPLSSATDSLPDWVNLGPSIRKFERKVGLHFRKPVFVSSYPLERSEISITGIYRIQFSEVFSALGRIQKNTYAHIWLEACEPSPFELSLCCTSGETLQLTQPMIAFRSEAHPCVDGSTRAPAQTFRSSGFLISSCGLCSISLHVPAPGVVQLHHTLFCLSIFLREILRLCGSGEYLEKFHLKEKKKKHATQSRKDL